MEETEASEIVELSNDLPDEHVSDSAIDSNQDESNEELSIVRPKLRSNQINGARPKVKQRVKFLSVDDSSTWQRAVVVSNRGKDGTQKAVDWKHDIIEWEVINEEIINKEVAKEESIKIRPEIEELNIKESVTGEVLLSSLGMKKRLKKQWTQN